MVPETTPVFPAEQDKKEPPKVTVAGVAMVNPAGNCAVTVSPAMSLPELVAVFEVVNPTFQVWVSLARYVDVAVAKVTFDN